MYFAGLDAHLRYVSASTKSSSFIATRFYGTRASAPAHWTAKSKRAPSAQGGDAPLAVVPLWVPFLLANPDISDNGTRRRRSEAIEKPTSCRLMWFP
jgi:hypothetical protein